MASTSDNPVAPSPSDRFSLLPSELQAAVLDLIRNEQGMKVLFPMRSLNRAWCRLIDDYLYDFFINGPNVLYCYVNLWNRFRQKLIQQRCILRLRCRTKRFLPPPGPAQKKKKHTSRHAKRDKGVEMRGKDDDAKSDTSHHTELNSEGMVSWQPTPNPSLTPSLRPPPKDYAAYIYDAVFDRKFEAEVDQIRVLDINPRTKHRLSLASGLSKYMEMNHQPARSGCVFPLFHVIQEAWDFVMAEDQHAMPLYPPIASEAWIQIRLLMVPGPTRWTEPSYMRIHPSQDPFWPFHFDEYVTPQADDSVRASGSHQYAVLSRLALPSFVQDEGIALVTLQDTRLEDWIEDENYREVMQGMMTVAEISGPQEFILGGAVCTIEDFERFIPPGMVEWYRKTVLNKRSTTNVSNASQLGDSKKEDGEDDGHQDDESEGSDEEEESTSLQSSRRDHPLTEEFGTIDGIVARLFSRLEWALTVLNGEGRGIFADLRRRHRT